MGQVFSGCGFRTPGIPFGSPEPRSSVIFCNIELDRRCATADDNRDGVDIARPFESGRASNIGLDKSAEAMAECPEFGRAIIHRSVFPDGDPLCVNPTFVPDTHATVNDACKAHCETLDEARDGTFLCDFIAWQAPGAEAPFPDACIASGSIRPDFVDPRKATPATPTPPTPTPTPPGFNPVAWTGATGVSVNGNDLVKFLATQWDNAGAVSQAQLFGDGRVQVVASEQTTMRIFGLGDGSITTNFRDVEFGILLRPLGEIQIFEASANAGVAGTYVTGDVLEVEVVGGVVLYKKNGTMFYRSTITPTFPLRVEAALFDQGATLTGARTSF